MATAAENICQNQMERAHAYKDNFTTTVGGLEFIMHPDVFNPEVFIVPTSMVDVWLHIIRTIKPDSLLEIGSGAGYFAIIAALNGVNQVTATDITQQAVDNIQANINKYDLTDRMTAKCGSVFEPLGENDRFDLIFWDFPFNSSTDKSVEELDALERTIYEPGYICVETYLKEAHKYLTDTGRLVIVFSHKLGDTDQLMKLINKYGWHLKLIEEPDQEIKLIEKTNNDDVDVNFYELIKQKNNASNNS